MPTLVFPNEQIPLRELYQPLSIRLQKRDNKEECYQIDYFDVKIVKKYRKILITDTAGMGKSTLMRCIGLSVLEERSIIPVLIDLRRLDKHSLIEEMIIQMDNFQKNFNIDLITSFIEQGHFLFLLDGYDEIPLDVQTRVTEDMRSFIEKAGNNYFIITSRPESSLAAFSDFQGFEMIPLSKADAFELIKKYDIRSKYKVAQNLIRDIETNIEQVKEFLGNPFLVSLLYKTYLYNKDIPSKKITFYSDVYEALYKHHDLTKDSYKRTKQSGLDIHDFRLVLRQLAFHTALKGKIEYTEQEFLQFLRSLKAKMPNIIFKENCFFEDLLSAVPIFMRDGSVIKWGHKSLQDFFAAEYLSFHPQKIDILDKLYDKGDYRFSNMLLLFQQIDEITFRRTILYRYLSDFINYCQTSFQKIENVSSEQIRFRQEITFESLLTYSINSYQTSLINAVQIIISKQYVGLYSENQLTISTDLRDNMKNVFKLNKSRIINEFDIEKYRRQRNIGRQKMIEDKWDKEIKENNLKNGLVFINDDNPTLLCNQAENFHIFSVYSMISHHNKEKRILTYDKVYNLKNQIESEMESEKLDDWLGEL